MLSNTAQAIKGFPSDSFETVNLIERIKELEDENAQLKDEHEYDQELLWNQRKTINTINYARAWYVIELMFATKPDNLGDVVFDSAKCIEILQNCPDEKLKLRNTEGNRLQVIRIMKLVPKLMPCIRIDQAGHNKKVYRLIYVP